MDGFVRAKLQKTLQRLIVQQRQKSHMVQKTHSETHKGKAHNCQPAVTPRAASRTNSPLYANDPVQVMTGDEVPKKQRLSLLANSKEDLPRETL